MERMTYKDPFGQWTVDLKDETGFHHLHGPHIERLAAYENTGLEPKDIRAGSEGRLDAFPCKPGDKIRDLLGDYIFTVEIIEVGHPHGTLFRCGNPGTDDYMAFYEDEIGKRVEILPIENH